ncbi:MAG: hypothetical protein ABJA57_09380 [Ginsengibacter sp.]
MQPKSWKHGLNIHSPFNLVMKKSAAIIFLFMASHLVSSSQSVKDKLDKEHNAANKENAGKADVLVQKRVIYDSALVKKTTITTSNKTVIHKRKKKLCIHKKNTHH